jgi:hypothetical protein
LKEKPQNCQIPCTVGCFQERPHREERFYYLKNTGFLFCAKKMTGMKNARITKVFSFPADKKRGNHLVLNPFHGFCPLGGG